MGRGSLGRVLLLQVLSHLVPLLLQESSHLVPLLLQESSLHFLSFFVKTFLVYFRNGSGDVIDQQAVLVIGETSQIAANLRISNIIENETVLTFQLPTYFINPSLTPSNVRPA